MLKYCRKDRLQGYRPINLYLVEKCGHLSNASTYLTFWVLPVFGQMYYMLYASVLNLLLLVCFSECVLYVDSFKNFMFRYINDAVGARLSDVKNSRRSQIFR